MERPTGIHYELIGVPECVEFIEDAEFIYLWCVVCTQQEVFTKFAQDADLRNSAHEHDHEY